MTGTAETLKAELIGNPTVDAMVSCADFGAAAGVNTVEQIGGKQMIGAFDFDPAALGRIKAGTQTKAIDQQPYLPGFLSTSTLFADLKFGAKISANPFLTGPAIIAAANADTVVAGAALSAR